MTKPGRAVEGVTEARAKRRAHVVCLGAGAWGGCIWKGRKKQWVISLGGRQGSDQEGHAKTFILEGF